MSVPAKRCLQGVDTKRGWCLIVAVLLVLAASTGAGAADILRIISPADGTEVTVGDNITVIVEVAPGTTLASPIFVMGGATGLTARMIAPPFTSVLTIPNVTKADEFLLQAVALLNTGTVVSSNLVGIYIEPGGAVSALKVTPPGLVLKRFGQEMPLFVEGQIPDGSLVSVTSSRRTAYFSSDPTVATVNAEGRVRATGPGRAIITVQYAGAKVGSTLVTSTAPPANMPPVAQCQNVTVSANAQCQATASINKSSFDPDGDAITLGQSPAGPYSLGARSVVLTVQDVLGQAAVCAGTVTVVDTSAPSIMCPAARTKVECTSPAGASVTLDAPTATDNCGVASVGCAPGSGTFPIGTTAISCSATDPAGNRSICASSVQVVDTTPPAVSCVRAANFRDGDKDGDEDGRDDAGHGLFQVSGQDLCSPTVTLSLGNVDLGNGETIQISLTKRPGIGLVQSRPGHFKHFKVGPGEAVIKGTDAAGNSATVTCPIPTREREYGREREKEPEGERERG